MQAYYDLLEGAEATCIERVTEIKNYSDWMTDLISMFSESFNSSDYVLAALSRK